MWLHVVNLQHGFNISIAIFANRVFRSEWNSRVHQPQTLPHLVTSVCYRPFGNGRNMKILLSPVLSDFRKSANSLWFKVSTNCLSGKNNMYIKMSMEHCWNYTDRENRVLILTVLKGAQKSCRFSKSYSVLDWRHRLRESNIWTSRSWDYQRSRGLCCTNILGRWKEKWLLTLSCLSVLMEQPGCQWTDFHAIWSEDFFEKSV